MNGKLTTHVLDTANGIPAREMRIECYDPDGELVAEAMTNADGRTDEPLVEEGGLREGLYEIRFHVGEYFRDVECFLDVVPVRFRVMDAGARYHVPLLCSPWAYSTYRGS
jgi:5-hydroxyisourate hydrolase